MSARIVAFAAILCLCARVLHAADNPAREKLREDVKAYLPRALSASVAPETVRALVADVDQRLSKGTDVRFIIDAGSTRGGKTVLGLTWGEQLHTFELTPAQTRALGVGPGKINVHSSSVAHHSRPDGEFPLKLERLTVDRANQQPGDKPITGSVMVRDNAGTNGLILRTLVCIDGAWLSATQDLEAIGADERVKFSIDPVNSKPEDIRFGPAVVIVDVIAGSSSEGVSRIVASGAGAVVDVQPDFEMHVRSSLRFMRDFTDILAKVQDASSAQAAIAEYKQAADRAKALADVLDRLGKPSPEEETRLMQKYEPELNELAARLQAEMTRLQNAPYAGQAFFDKLDATMKK